MAEAPTLRKAGRHLPLRVPVGYFETLPGRVLRVINPAPATKGQAWWPEIGYRMAAVAAVLGLLLLLWGPAEPSPAAQPLTWAALPTESLLALVEAEVDDPDLILKVMAEGRTPPDVIPVDAWLQDLDVTDLEAALLEAEGQP
jgi:hypothetical protein